MPRTIRALAACALLSSLAACVVQQPAPAPAPRPNPQQIADERLHQVEGRIDNLSRRIDNRVNQGYYPPPQGGALHHRLDVIRQEAHDMAAQHGGGLSGDEQRVLNQELDNAAHAIGE
jgi:curli biogenesis system outer membrane secretion channel CsgG